MRISDGGSLQKEELVGAYSSQLYPQWMGGTAADSGSRKLKDHIFNHKQRAERKHRKWGDATVSHSQPSSDTLLQQALSPQVFNNHLKQCHQLGIKDLNSESNHHRHE